MEVKYQRGAGKRYLVIGFDGDKGRNYEVEMLQENEIEALLPFYSVVINGKKELWYDITGKQSVDEYLGNYGIEAETLYQVFYYASQALKIISSYLINEKNIYFSPETMFIKNESMELCYYPGGETSDDRPFERLGEYLIENVGTENAETEKLCYSIYEKTVKPGFSCGETAEDLSKIIMNTGEKNDIEVNSPGSKEEDLPDEGLHGLSQVDEIQMQKESPVKKDMLMEKINMLREKVMSLKNRIQGQEEDEGPAEALKRDPGRLIYDGKDKEDDFIIDREVFRIGNDSKNDGYIGNRMVSRHNSRITRRNGHFYLSDWNSKNGTYHNGRRLNKGENVELNQMDRINFANVPYIWLGTESD